MAKFIPQNPTTPTQLETALTICRAANKPVMIWGDTGVGKTSLVSYWAKEIERCPIICAPNLSMSESVDFRGVPGTIQEAEFLITQWARPGWLPRNLVNEGGVMVFDECNINRALFGALYEIIWERKCGEHIFGKQWLPILLGNYQHNGALAVNLPSACNNRLAHFDYMPDWKFYTGTLAPRIGLHPIVTAYIKFRPDYLHIMPGNEPDATHIPRIPKEARAYPTCRAWEGVSDMLKQVEKMNGGLTSDAARQMTHAALVAVVGPESAADFMSFFDVATKFVTPAQIVADPNGAPLPTTGGLCHAVVTALAAHATPANFAAIMTYGKRVAAAGYGEAYVIMGLEAGRRNPVLKETAAYCGWIDANKSLIV